MRAADLDRCCDISSESSDKYFCKLVSANNKIVHCCHLGREKLKPKWSHDDQPWISAKLDARAGCSHLLLRISCLALSSVKIRHVPHDVWHFVSFFLPCLRLSMSRLDGEVVVVVVQAILPGWRYILTLLLRNVFAAGLVPQTIPSAFVSVFPSCCSTPIPP